MASDYSKEEIQELYEGDQSKLYSGVFNHHKDIKSDESKNQVKKFVKIMIYLAIVTAIEVSLGLWDHHTPIFSHHGILAAIFLCMTLLKAYLIVDVFMHLGTEFANFIKVILIPLLLITWMIIAFMSDGSHSLFMNNTRAQTEQLAHPIKPLR